MNEDSENRPGDLSRIVLSSVTGGFGRLIQRGLESLEVRSELGLAEFRKSTPEFKGLSDRALLLLQGKEACWEWLLFLQVMNDEIASYESLRQSIEQRITLSPPTQIHDLREATMWMDDVWSKKLVHIAKSMADVVNVEFVVATAPPGVPADVIGVLRAARKIGLLYKQLLDLSLECSTAERPDNFDALFLAMADDTCEIAFQLERFGIDSITRFRTALAEAGSEPFTCECHLSFTSSRRAWKVLDELIAACGAEHAKTRKRRGR